MSNHDKGHQNHLKQHTEPPLQATAHQVEMGSITTETGITDRNDHDHDHDHHNNNNNHHNDHHNHHHNDHYNNNHNDHHNDHYNDHNHGTRQWHD